VTAPEEDQTLSTPEPEIEPETEPETETETPAVEDEVVVEVEIEPDLDTDVEIEGLDAVAPIPAVFSDRPIQTVGRRKEAIVRVRLMPGTGKFTLNGRTLEQYFPNKLHQQLIREPLVTVDKAERFDIFANLGGGGTSGQAGALRLAIARALIEVDPDDRPPLKRAGFLTRDPRVIERKKYGLKKARKAPQYSKR
jgi:small subunit ribosomal protein S9